MATSDPLGSASDYGIRNDVIICGVDVRPATTSCSALALALLTGTSVLAQSHAPVELSLFPQKQVWNQPLDAAVTAQPGFGPATAFLPLEDAHVAAFDLANGVVAWTRPGQPISQPAVGDGLVFLSEADAIRALRQDSGDLAWQVSLTAPLSVPLVWDNGWLVAADAAGVATAFRAVDGAVVWRHSAGAPLHAPPALAADRVYLPLSDNRVVALDVATGAPVWERRLGGPANDILALDDRVYAGSDDNYFYCLMPRTGEVSWRWRTGGDIVGPAVADTERVYFVSKDNVLRSLDRHSGAQRWQKPLPVRPTRGPIRVGDLLLVSGLAPRVLSFSVRSGTPGTDLAAPGELAAQPHEMRTRGIPQVVLIARDQAAGARVVAVRRTIDPPADAALPALPGAITVKVAVADVGAGAVRPAGAERAPGTAGSVEGPAGRRLEGRLPEPR